MDLREHAATLRQHADRKHRPFDIDHVAPDVVVHLETPTGFAIVEKK